MQSKPWYLSKTIVSGIVGFVVAFVAIFHVDLHDLAPKIVDATTQVIQAVLAVASLVGLIYGRIHVDQKLVAAQAAATATSPMRNVVIGMLIGCVLLSSQVLICCAPSPTPSPTSSPAPVVSTTSTAMQTWVDSNSNLFYDVGYFGAMGWETGAVKQGATRTRINNIISLASSGISELDAGQGFTSAQVQSGITMAGGNNATAQDALYTNLITTVSGPIATAIGWAGSDAKAIADGLAFIAKGMSAYGSTVPAN
jgi:hypothetical protein